MSGQKKHRSSGREPVLLASNEHPRAYFKHSRKHLRRERADDIEDLKRIGAGDSFKKGGF